MVNGLHLYSAFIQSSVQFMPLIHTHTFTHQRRLAAMQGTNQHVKSNWRLGVLLKDTSTRPGWDRTLRLPDDSSYLLSHIAPPKNMAIELWHYWKGSTVCRKVGLYCLNTRGRSHHSKIQWKYNFSFADVLQLKNPFAKRVYICYICWAQCKAQCTHTINPLHSKDPPSTTNSQSWELKTDSTLFSWISKYVTQNMVTSIILNYE